MSRCSCAGGGSVAIEGGTNVTVEGSGTAVNPYRISAKAANFIVADTSSVDLTITGDGTSGNPYSISAALKPAAGFWYSEAESDWTGSVSLVNPSYDAPRVVRRRLVGNITAVTLPTWPANQAGEIMLVLRQDGVGSRTWVQPGKSAYGYKIVLSTAANAVDVIQAYWTGTDWVLTPAAMAIA